MNEKYFAIIPAVFVIFFLTAGIMFLKGKWSKIIPGYGISAKNQDAIFFERIFCRFVGIYVLIIDIFFALIFAGLVFDTAILSAISGGIGAAVAIFGYIGILNNTRAKRALFLAKNLEKNPRCLTVEEIEKWKNELRYNKRIKRKIKQ